MAALTQAKNDREVDWARTSTYYKAKSKEEKENSVIGILARKANLAFQIGKDYLMLQGLLSSSVDESREEQREFLQGQIAEKKREFYSILTPEEENSLPRLPLYNGHSH